MPIPDSPVERGSNSPTTDELLAPVHRNRRRDGKKPEEGIALCLSGGGYRAMVFHVGVLWRLNETGLLAKINQFSSVSGGSITGAALAARWNQLEFDEAGVARNFNDALVAPIRAMASSNVDVVAVLAGALLPGQSIADRVARAYRKHLFGDASLQDLPDTPIFVFNATNLESGVLLRISKQYLGDYRVGRILNPDIDLGTVVAASSAFPPVLSPCTLNLKGQSWVPDGRDALTAPGFRNDIKTSDGGVYDNLGLETAWKNYETILVSDAGGKLRDKDDVPDNWPFHTLRVLKVIDNQVRALRKRQLIGSFKTGVRKGMYCGIRSQVADYPVHALSADPTLTKTLAEIPTRLSALDEPVQERLINWGYKICDTGLRSHVLRKELEGVPATSLPYERELVT